MEHSTLHSTTGDFKDSDLIPLRKKSSIVEQLEMTSTCYVTAERPQNKVT
jgi:hypothetical protein